MAPDTRGRVSVRFTVAPSGEVVESRIVASEIPLEGLNECMRKRALRLTFPAFEGDPVVVTMTLTMGAACGG